MAELNLKQIADKLNAEFTGDVRKLVFWYDDNAEFAKIETLELTDLPRRPDRTTRVRVVATPIADDKIAIEIRDLGFGEFFRGTDKVWKYTMVM